MPDTSGAPQEGDEPPETGDDNSLGRLLALSDGVFAIAMTLLALDLRAPDLGDGATDAALRHALADGGGSYLSFLISFYVIGGYWLIHRRLLRHVKTMHAGLTMHTLTVLLLVAALPFPASVLGEHGDLPTGLALYGAFNAVIVLALLRLRRDVRRFEPSDGSADDDPTRLFGDLVVFLLCIPGAYALRSHGPYLLLLLFVSGRLPYLRRRLIR